MSAEQFKVHNHQCEKLCNQLWYLSYLPILKILGCIGYIGIGFELTEHQKIQL